MSLDVAALYPQDVQSAASAALSPLAAGMTGSAILGIASEVRALAAQGVAICNLTVGDFDPSQFQVPTTLGTAIGERIAEGQTNYPPSDGLPELRQAVADYYEAKLGVRFPMGSVVIGSGARPPLYAAFRCILSPGDTYVYGLPTWNNEYYAYLNGADAVALQTRPEDGFFLTAEALRPHLGRARLVHLNSPLNPCGTVIEAEALAAICQAIVEENRRREAAGRESVMLLFDMVYWQLTFGDAVHHDPITLVPEIAPYVLYVDAISKCFAATGLRVGWGVVPSYLQPKMKALIGHMGAWSPRPIQLATATLLRDHATIATYMEGFGAELRERLDLIFDRFTAMKAEGLPVDAIPPQGAIYLSIQIGLIGRTTPGGQTLDTNDAIRRYLLDEARVAVVPFRAFGLEGESGWFRMSIGAVGVDELAAGLDRVAAAIRATR